MRRHLEQMDRAQARREARRPLARVRAAAATSTTPRRMRRSARARSSAGTAPSGPGSSRSRTRWSGASTRPDDRSSPGGQVSGAPTGRPAFGDPVMTTTNDRRRCDRVGPSSRNCGHCAGAERSILLPVRPFPSAMTFSRMDRWLADTNQADTPVCVTSLCTSSSRPGPRRRLRRRLGGRGPALHCHIELVQRCRTRMKASGFDATTPCQIRLGNAASIHSLGTWPAQNQAGFESRRHNLRHPPQRSNPNSCRKG